MQGHFSAVSPWDLYLTLRALVIACVILNFNSLAEILSIKCLAHYLAYNRH